MDKIYMVEPLSHALCPHGRNSLFQHLRDLLEGEADSIDLLDHSGENTLPRYLLGCLLHHRGGRGRWVWSVGGTRTISWGIPSPSTTCTIAITTVQVGPSV